MKRKNALFLTAALLLLSTAAAAETSLAAQNIELRPLVFTRNEGQWDAVALFNTSHGGVSVWFTRDKVCYQFAKTFHDFQVPNCSPGNSRLGSDSVATLSITASFVGANLNPQAVGENQLEYKCNYLIGNNPAQWRIDVPNYGAVVYKDIYPGIDLRYYGNGDGKLEYDFIIQPGADPSHIAVHYEGAKTVYVNDEGELVAETEWGKVAEQRPAIYQLDGAKKIPISGTYVMIDENTFGFRLKETFRPELALIIDPTLSYSTYLGGCSSESGYGDGAVAADTNGNAYVSGSTFSTNFPTLNPLLATNQGSWDAFVTKFNVSGNGLIYSTYLGGSNEEYSFGVTVDSSGDLFLTGQTNSSNFPTQNPFQGSFQGGQFDVFVAKLNASGNALIYSTYLGGGDDDRGSSIVIDRSGNSYVTGYTASSNFPTQNPYQTHQGPSGYDDAFVAKLSFDGGSLIYSTYLGGTSTDAANSIAIDVNGNAYVTGVTNSTNFPTQSPIQTFQGAAGFGDAFVTKLSAAGNSLIYSTYLGGGNDDVAKGIAVDGSGNAYVTGSTSSTNFPTQNPFQGTFQGAPNDAFITKINSSGNAFVYSTYLGGANEESGSKVVLDFRGDAYVTGYTMSSNFPTKNPFQANIGGSLPDVFITELNGSGNGISYSTYFGGSGSELGSGIAIANDGVFVTGYTFSIDFPTLNAFQASRSCFSADGFVLKFQVVNNSFLCGDANGDQTLNISDAVYLISYIFSGGPAPNPVLSGDSNCDTTVNISDAVYLISYIFNGGPAPCAACK